MAFKEDEGAFDDKHIGSFLRFAIEDYALRINSITPEGISFTIRKGLRNDQDFFIKSGETLEYKQEGNAAGFEYLFRVEV